MAPRRSVPGEIALTSFGDRRDRTMFAAAYNDPESGITTGPRPPAPVCVAPLTYAVVKRLGMLKVDHYALPNVLAGEAVVPELMQHDCTPENLAGACLRWLRDPLAAAALLPKFQRIHLELKRDASARAADAVLELISENASA